MTATSYTRDAYIADLRAERDEAQAEAEKVNAKVARQRALIAELVGALEGILKRSVARGTLEIPCDGPIADLIRAVLAKTREESA